MFFVCLFNGARYSMLTLAVLLIRRFFPLCRNGAAEQLARRATLAMCAKTAQEGRDKNMSVAQQQQQQHTLLIELSE